MRLQVSIRRHALPVVNIIFTTGTGPASKTLAPNATVTDLLHDVNDLVPLESADGEWGLEDYVLEVQATADQETYYECLHYQIIDSVLREDDEVVIRSLGTEDLRSRRLGGRHQISADGRHLIDGVAFGRQWLRKGGRPAINIPPRKRRRLEIDGDEEELDEESTTLLQQLKKLGYSNENFDESDEDDDDFVDEANDDDKDEVPKEDEGDQPMRIKATAEFDDADVDENEESEQESEDDEDEIMTGAGLELSDELKALLVEAEQLSENDTYHRLPSEAAQSPRKGKRKREVEEDNESEDASDFEGFLTPSKPPEEQASPGSSVSSVSMSDDTTVSSDSNSDSASDDAAGPTDTSSSRTSDSGESSSLETSDSDSDDESSSDNSSSESSSEDESKLKEAQLPSSSSAKQASSQAHSTGSSSASILNTISPKKRVQAAPGEGLKITQRNNMRARKRARLARLKQDGILPANANFADMAALEEQAKAREAANGEVQVDHQSDLESKKKALLQQLHLNDETVKETMSEAPKVVENHASFVDTVRQDQAANTEDIGVNEGAADGELEPDINTDLPVKDNEIDKENMTLEDIDVDESVPSQEIGTKAQESFIGKATPKSTEKRAKLDLASSRRMLFNSLGLRTPKTPEAEQALREKLAQNIPKIPQRISEERANEESQREDVNDNDMDSWKERIMLLAVECEYEGVKLSIPPFPFKQGWDSNANMRRGASKKKGRKQPRYYDQNEDYVAEYAPDLSTMQDQGKPTPSEDVDRPESRTLSLEEQVADEMPRPSDFGSLVNLAAVDLAPGAVIAFKELDIQNFQPVVSGYRVGRVRDVQIEGSSKVIELMLSKKDWPASRRRSDAFAIEDEDKQPEDGVRVRRYADLIEPKLIETSSVQVSTTPTQTQDQVLEDNSSTSVKQAQSSTALELGDATHDSTESAPSKSRVLTMSHVEVNTPRRNEITAIIKEAGFDSAIDNDLLQPEPEPEPEPQSSPAFHTRSHRSQRSSSSPVPVSMHATTTSVTAPRFDSPGLNGWGSSPLPPLEGAIDPGAPSQISRQHTPAARNPETQPNVSYPALSQLEHDPSGVAVTNDSSFQDAQRVSQPPDIDTSNLRPDLDTSKLHPEYPYDDFGQDETQRSLGSEVQQTQSQSPSPSSKAASEKLTVGSSFLGRGLDGQASSDEEGDFDSDNSSLPSLRELTSSQNRKIKHAARRSRVSPPATRASKISISPPAHRGKRLRNGKKHSASPEQSESDNGVELPLVKMSQSQALRMSEKPVGSQIVDLTFSSSPAGPESDAEYQAPRTRGARAKKYTKRPGVRGQNSGSMSEDEAGEDPSQGIGKRRFLTTKKWRSHD